MTLLLNSDLPLIKSLKISALVRTQAQADKLSQIGVTPILIKDLDDTETITKAASENDGTIVLPFGFSSVH